MMEFILSVKLQNECFCGLSSVGAVMEPLVTAELLTASEGRVKNVHSPRQNVIQLHYSPVS